jgi:hypothetical protein
MGNATSSFRVITDKITATGYANFFALDAGYNAISYNGEEIFTAVCSWVIRDEHQSAYVTTGHGENPDATLYNALLCAGYYVNEIDLKQEEVPDNADLLIIANPTNDFERAAEGSTHRAELDRLVAYRNRGGRFFVTMDPYARRLPTLTAFISEFGVAPKLTSDGRTQLVKDTGSAITNDGFTVIADYSSDEVSREMLTRSKLTDAAVVIKNASPLALSGNARAILTSSPSAICQAGGETTDRDGGYALAAYSTFDNGTAEDASLFFTSSVYLFANEAMITDGYTNKDFLYSVFDVVFDGGDMPYGCTPVVYDTEILENLTLGTKILYTAMIMAVPAAIAIVGAVIVVRRKNR